MWTCRVSNLPILCLPYILRKSSMFTVSNRMWQMLFSSVKTHRAFSMGGEGLIAWTSHLKWERATRSPAPAALCSAHHTRRLPIKMTHKEETAHTADNLCCKLCWPSAHKRNRSSNQNKETAPMSANFSLNKKKWRKNKIDDSCRKNQEIIKS